MYHHNTNWIIHANKWENWFISMKHPCSEQPSWRPSRVLPAPHSHFSRTISALGIGEGWSFCSPWTPNEENCYQHAPTTRDFQTMFRSLRFFLLLCTINSCTRFPSYNIIQFLPIMWWKLNLRMQFPWWKITAQFKNMPRSKTVIASSFPRETNFHWITLLYHQHNFPNIFNIKVIFTKDSTFSQNHHSTYPLSLS